MTKPGSRSSKRLAAVVLAVLASTALVRAQNRGRPLSERSFDYARGADTIVVQLNRDVGITDADPIPLLRIYGDGRALVHFPAYMRRAGDYTLQLGDAEMANLMAAVVDIMEFDPAVTSSQLRALEASQRARATPPGQPGTLFTRSEEVTTDVELRLERYRPAGSSAEIPNPVKRATWRGLQIQAERFPEIAQLGGLAGIERRLLDICERPDLTPARE